MAAELKRRGICRKSTSDHRAFPVALVKPNGKIRTCVDWRRLNKKTREYALGKPLIKDIIWKLGGGNANFLTVMDCSEGYYQIKLKDNASMRRTAIWMPPSEHLEFTRLPFGLKNAVSQFIFALNVVLGDLVGKACHVFIYDIICVGKTEEESVKNFFLVVNA